MGLGPVGNLPGPLFTPPVRPDWDAAPANNTGFPGVPFIPTGRIFGRRPRLLALDGVWPAGGQQEDTTNSRACSSRTGVVYQTYINCQYSLLVPVRPRWGCSFVEIIGGGWRRWGLDSWGRSLDTSRISPRSLFSMIRNSIVPVLHASCRRKESFGLGRARTRGSRLPGARRVTGEIRPRFKHCC